MVDQPKRRQDDNNPSEPSKINENERNELIKKENQVIDKIDTDNFISNLKGFFDSSVDITIISVKDMVKSEEDLNQIKNALKTSFKYVADTYIIKKNNGSLKFEVDTYKKDFGLDNSNKLKLPDNIRTNIQNIDNIDNIANDILANLGASLAGVCEKYTPGIKKQLNDKNGPIFTENSTQQDIDNCETFSENISQRVTSEQANRYRDDQTASEENQITDPDGDPTKNESTWTLKDVVKFAGILIGAFKFVSLLLILINYALTHSGCMRFSCDEGDTTAIGFKAFCYAPPGNQSPFSKLLNPTSGVLDFSSDRCACNLEGSIYICDSSTCQNPTKNKLTPYLTGCPNSNFQCKGSVDKGCPVTYYSFRLFNPMQLFPDAANTIENKAPKFLDYIIHAAIVIGIILGVLLVLWIIYKVVANRKPAETLNIETVGAPSTITKFGNRGYLGNLSKYNNYAYMGRCVAQPARPYIPHIF